MVRTVTNAIELYQIHSQYRRASHPLAGTPRWLELEAVIAHSLRRHPPFQSRAISLVQAAQRVQPGNALRTWLRILLEDVWESHGVTVLEVGRLLQQSLGLKPAHNSLRAVATAFPGRSCRVTAIFLCGCVPSMAVRS